MAKDSISYGQALRLINKMPRCSVCRRPLVLAQAGSHAACSSMREAFPWHEVRGMSKRKRGRSMPEVWDRKPRKAQSWDEPLPFPDSDTGPVSSSGSPPFLVCSRCRYAYWTAEELVREDSIRRNEAPRNVDEVADCPRCRRAF